MRWPWTRVGPEEDDIRRLEHAVSVLTASLNDTQADVRRLQAEWLDMYDKLVRRDERLRKREERAAGPADPTPNGKAALWSRVKAGGHRGTV